KLMEEFDNKLKQVIPELRRLGNKELFEPFMQTTARGKRTNHLINPYTDTFFKERAKFKKGLNKEDDGTSMTKYANWISESAIQTKLDKIFPVEGSNTSDIENAKQELRNAVGEGVFNYWYKRQAKKI